MHTLLLSVQYHVHVTEFIVPKIDDASWSPGRQCLQKDFHVGCIWVPGSVSRAAQHAKSLDFGWGINGHNCNRLHFLLARLDHVLACGYRLSVCNVNNTWRFLLAGSRQSMMDSSSRRLPFCLSSTRSSYISGPSVSSSSLGSSRLNSRETTLSNDRFQRGPSSYKTDLDQQVGQTHDKLQAQLEGHKQTNTIFVLNTQVDVDVLIAQAVCQKDLKSFPCRPGVFWLVCYHDAILLLTAFKSFNFCPCKHSY